MTTLERAFAKAAELPPEEQEALGERLLAELAAEDEFDRKLAATAHRLRPAAEAALAEHRAGLTQPLDPDRL